MVALINTFLDVENGLIENYLFHIFFSNQIETHSQVLNDLMDIIFMPIRTHSINAATPQPILLSIAIVYLNCLFGNLESNYIQIEILGKRRASMPKIPSLSDEKRGACLEALRWLVGGKKEPTTELYSNYKETDATYGRRKVVETLWKPNRPENKIGPMNIAAIQRYKKLVYFKSYLHTDNFLPSQYLALIYLNFF